MNYHLKKILILSVIYLMCLLGINTETSAQQLNVERIKAAYVINFIKHIKWPNENNKKDYQLYIYKDKNFSLFLANSLSKLKQDIKNKPIQVNVLNRLSKNIPIDILYIPEQYNKVFHQIANTYRGTQTLIISNNSLNKHDVMINLVYNKQNRAITFEINKSNIVYEHLKMSPELLLLGGTELDIATLYRETEAAMQQTREKDIKLRQQLKAQQQELKHSLKQLQLSKKQLDKSIQETQQQKLELKKLKNDVIKKQQLLIEQQQKLTQVSKLYNKNKQQLIEQQKILNEKEQQNKKMLTKVAENKAILAKQNKQLEEHRLQLEQQDQELINRNQTINSQQAYLLITSILVAIAVFVSLLVVFFFIKNKKTTKKLAKTLANLENTQEQLIQSEKMASLGGLVAGVAHEINTPLGIAITSNSLVIDDTKDIKDKIIHGKLSKTRMNQHIEKTEQSLTMAEKALERVRILLANFKQVAADQIVDDKRELNLAEYIDEIMMTLSVELKKHHINYQFTGDDTIKISTLPGALAQVLTNLVNNSIRHGFENRDAGNITITLLPHSNTNGETEQWAATIIYQDDGVGMSGKVLENIFEPFFTTKRGKGSTGLGMNIVYNIISQKLKGDIKIISEEGKGSTFTIYLPKSI